MCQNKTKVGLKELPHRDWAFPTHCQNKTKVGLKGLQAILDKFGEDVRIRLR